MYVDRKSVIESMENAEFEIDCEENPDPVAWVASVIDAMIYCVQTEPSADVAPVVHGQWIFDSFLNRRCSKCRAKSKSEPTSGLEKYCHNCGVKMDEKE